MSNLGESVKWGAIVFCFVVLVVVGLVILNTDKKPEIVEPQTTWQKDFIDDVAAKKQALIDASITN